MKSKYSDKIAITTGDINGIGAEITYKALNMSGISPDKFVIISNSDVLKSQGYLNHRYEII